MRIGPLESIDSVSFCKAFEDYAIPIHMDEETFQKENHRLGFCKDLSLGLYDGEELVGFLLNSRRGDTVYDSGTGIQKAYRGQGYGKAMVEKVISTLPFHGVRKWILEVLSDNKGGIALYTHCGFVPKRKLDCWRIMTSLLTPTNDIVLVPCSPSLLPSDPPHHNSWQNSKESIVMGDIPTYLIMDGGKQVGILSFEPHSGSLMALYIKKEYRKLGYGCSALGKLPSLTKNGMVKCNNVDEAYEPLENLFQKTGFSCYCSQYEMEREF